MANILTALSISVVIAVVYFYLSYRKLCVEISAKHKRDFFLLAKKLIEDPSSNDNQRSRINKWAETIDNKLYALAIFAALRTLYKDLKAGRYPDIDEDQLKDYSKELAELFLFWLWALIYSVPLLSLFSKDLALYIFNPENHKRNAAQIVEVNRDVFCHQRLSHAA